MLCELFFRPRPSSSQMFASHIANTCIFLFLFGGTAIHMLFFQIVEVDFGTLLRASMVKWFLFATAMCYIFFFYASVNTGLVSLKAPADASHIISFPWQPTPLIITISLEFSFI